MWSVAVGEIVGWEGRMVAKMQPGSVGHKFFIVRVSRENNYILTNYMVI